MMYVEPRYTAHLYQTLKLVGRFIHICAYTIIAAKCKLVTECVVREHGIKVPDDMFLRSVLGCHQVTGEGYQDNVF
jgi:hypothetical protein